MHGLSEVENTHLAFTGKGLCEGDDAQPQSSLTLSSSSPFLESLHFLLFRVPASLFGTENEDNESTLLTARSAPPFLSDQKTFAKSTQKKT